jgi:hypothetical protein
VDVTDDGIDDGDATPIHADFYVLGNTSNPDRLIYNYNWTTDPLADGRAGHGNINASIAVGYNNRTGFPYEDSNGYNYGLGINPFGRVAGSKVFNNAGGGTRVLPPQTCSTTPTPWAGASAATRGAIAIKVAATTPTVRNTMPGCGMPGRL